MTAGYQLTAGQMRAIRETVRTVMMQHGGGNVDKPRQQVQRNLQGKLDGELASAGAFENNPATATMSVWSKNAAGNMVDTGNNIIVVNRMLNISIPAGTIVKAHWIDGEWQISGADCEGV